MFWNLKRTCETYEKMKNDNKVLKFEMYSGFLNQQPMILYNNT